MTAILKSPRMNKAIVLTILIVLALGLGAFFFIPKLFFAPTQQPLPQSDTRGSIFDFSQMQVHQNNLSVPWGIAELPNGSLLISERTGTLTHFDVNSERSTIELPQHIQEVGEGGLLGITLHPLFEENNWIYIYHTQQAPDGTFTNRLVRYTFLNLELSEETEIIGNIPGARFHDGGRIAFGPDGYLYATTGDAGAPELAQDTNSLAGKILRIQDDGTIPIDNPFSNAVYSYGHRNPQGIAWDAAGKLWSTEHGRSGIRSGFDELNKIERGGNYGWPVIQGSEAAPNMHAPVIHSGADITWAPGGLTIVGNRAFWGGLRGQSLYEAELTDTGAALINAHFFTEFGRLRTTTLLSDGSLLITTSNTDGRGSPSENDDVVLRVR